MISKRSSAAQNSTAQNSTALDGKNERISVSIWSDKQEWRQRARMALGPSKVEIRTLCIFMMMMELLLEYKARPIGWLPNYRLCSSAQKAKERGKTKI
jgi:hypothetical protein